MELREQFLRPTIRKPLVLDELGMQCFDHFRCFQTFPLDIEQDKERHPVVPIDFPEQGVATGYMAPGAFLLPVTDQLAHLRSWLGD